jgi:CRP-like cAMP-binding protein
VHPIDVIKKFGTITPEQELSLRNLMCDYMFQKGDVIQGVKNLTSFVYFLTKGSARLFYTEHGREHTSSFSFSDEFIVVPRHILLVYPETVAVEFLEPSTVIFVPHLQVRNLLESDRATPDTEGLLFLSAALLQYCRELEERVDVMQTLDAEQRYRWVLNRYPRLTDCATTTQIASFLGVTKETLYRIKNGKYQGSKRRKATIQNNNDNNQPNINLTADAIETTSV